MEGGKGAGLVGLPPELVHKVALGGDLGFEDVKALALSCRRMKAILIDDDYGRNIHYAMKGVVENVKGKRWRAARYAVNRAWFADGEEDETGLWGKVAGVVVGKKKVALETPEELTGWENVMLAVLSLEGASGWETGGWETTANACVYKLPLLHIAVEAGSERVVDWLLERGVDLEARNTSHSTPLWEACRAGHLGIVRRLVESGAEADVEGRGMLHWACLKGSVGMLRLLVDAGSGSEVDKDRGVWVEGLVAAARCGHVDVIRELLEVGVSVDGVDGTGQTALVCASWEGHDDVVQVLVSEGGADVAKATNAKGTPLVAACRQGKVEIVQYLLVVGAGVELEKGRESLFDRARVEGWDDDVVGVLDVWGGGYR